jgi:periplasmic copper chaperone A
LKEFNMNRTIASALLVSAFLTSPWAQAQALDIDNAWIRPTVAGQQGTGGFMLLRSKDGVTLTGVSAPASVGTAELHEMKMDGDVMRMRAIETLAVPAGQTVTLKPGGYHLMLVGLRAPLPQGAQVSVTFSFKDAKGKPGKLEVKIPVAASAPGGAASPAPVHKH